MSEVECSCGPNEACSLCARAARAERSDVSPTRGAGKLERELLVEGLSAAAVRLRDAELEIEAARKHYGERLQAFNRFVAPVPQ